jgi:D-threo-aldose 1-dehydrogenase
MLSRSLGAIPLETTVLGFGASAIGGLYRAVSRDAAFETMEAAWNAGIRYFDTAPFYGFGLSERRVGDFLRGRNDYVLSTKVGKLLSPVPESEIPNYGFVDPLSFKVDYDYRYDAIMRSYEFSLARLGLPRIDILYVHDLEIRSLGAEAYKKHFRDFMDGGIRALEELKRGGSITAIGLGCNDVDACLDVLSRAPLDCLLLAGRYTLLDRSAAARLLPMCVKSRVALVVGGAFNSGILATGPTLDARFDYSTPSKDIIERVRCMQATAEDVGISLAAAALQFPLLQPNVASVLVGTAKPLNIIRDVALLHTQVPSSIWPRFESFALSAEPSATSHYRTALPIEGPTGST